MLVLEDGSYYLVSSLLLLLVVVVVLVFVLSSSLSSLGILGFTKFGHISYIPVTFAVLFGLLTMIGGIYLDSAQNWAFIVLSSSSSSSSSSINKNTTTANNNNNKIKYNSGRTSLLNNIAFKVLFLGGYSYNAALFFTFQDQESDQFYLVFMSLSFTISLTIVSWASFYNNSMYNCTREELQVEYAFQTNYFYQATVIMAIIVVMFLLIGFAFTGVIKSHIYYTNWKDYYPVMTVSAITTAILCVLSLQSVKRNYDIANITTSNNDNNNSSNTNTNSNTNSNTNTNSNYNSNTYYNSNSNSNAISSSKRRY